MQIVFLCSEYEGLLKTGGLADATRGLAQALLAEGHQVTVLMPRYGSLYQTALLPEWQSLYFPLAEQRYGCAIRHLQLDGVQIGLIEHHDFFQRPRPYDDGEHGYSDNALRFAFFCRAALQYLTSWQQAPAIIHGHDWQSALGAVYLRQLQQQGQLQHSRFVLSIHNAAYQQMIGQHELGLLGLSQADVPPDAPLSLLGIGVWQAAALNTVSQGYREELLSEPAANGLSALYQARQADFVGILNGCDYQRWDPSTDPMLSHNYHSGDLTGKAGCKTSLLQRVGWQTQSQALFVAVSRVTGQKGFSLLLPALRQWLPSTQARVLMMGTGEQQFIQPLLALMADFPAQFHFIQGFDEALSHQLEAAGDFFLMPSLFEPCGLNQIYSLRYGTVPLVRATGGLKDTVVAYPACDATGIRFDEAEVPALLAALQQAEQLYADPAQYRLVQQRGMQQVFSWQASASLYLQLYHRLQA
jgi:starch synthase